MHPVAANDPAAGEVRCLQPAPGDGKDGNTSKRYTDRPVGRAELAPQYLGRGSGVNDFHEHLPQKGVIGLLPEGLFEKVIWEPAV